MADLFEQFIKTAFEQKFFSDESLKTRRNIQALFIQGGPWQESIIDKKDIINNALAKHREFSETATLPKPSVVSSATKVPWLSFFQHPKNQEHTQLKASEKDDHTISPKKGR